jgi:hypothetical protein
MMSGATFRLSAFGAAIADDPAHHLDLAASDIHAIELRGAWGRFPVRVARVTSPLPTPA